MKITKRIMQIFNGDRKKKLPNPLFKEEVKNKSKKKKHRKIYISPWEICPFCKKELPTLHRESMYVMEERQSWCNNCGASWVKECPACKRPTWVSLDGIYKHHGSAGCGFVGKKKEDKNVRS